MDELRGPAGQAGGRVPGGVGVQPGGDGRRAEVVDDPPGEDLHHDRGADRVQGEAGFGAALGGFDRDRVGDPVGDVPVGGWAGVPAFQGMVDESFPAFLLQGEPVPFRDALLDPPDQNGVLVHAFDVDGLVGGEQRDALAGELFFDPQRGEGVAGGAFDVFDDDGGEFRDGCFGVLQQVGQAAVAGDAEAGELPPGVVVAALFQVQAAGFDVPVPGGDEPAGRQPFLRGADLTAQRRGRVLQDQGGGPAEERDRDRFGWLRRAVRVGQPAYGSGLQLSHWSTSMIAFACRASISLARFPVAIRTLNRTFIPSGLLSSLRL